ncbi:MAG TPA: hypothetical protein VI653_17910 [Steroidobacteraceae bacterium]
MKVSKRDFVKGAAATVVLVAAVSRVRSSSRFDAVVYNEWFPQARTYAEGLATQGVRALPIGGDAGRLWYDTLRALVSQGHRRIAGMTTHTDLLILETLARDTRLRVSQRESAGRLVSWVLL